MAEAIHDRKEENGSILPENRIGQKRTRQGQKINSGNKRVIPGLCLLVAEVIGMAVSVEHVFGHEDHEDRVQAIIAEALGRFVPDDVGHPRRHLGGLDRSSDIFWHWGVR